MRLLSRLVLFVALPVSLLLLTTAVVAQPASPVAGPAERFDRCQRKPDHPRCQSTTTTTQPPATTTTTTTPPPTTTTTLPGGTDRWMPEPGTTWQWQLTQAIDTTYDVEVYDIDLFDVPASTVASLKADGRKVICYVSVGSFEDWRPDAAAFPSHVLGNSNGWPGEKWLDIRQIDDLGPIMEARLDLCVEKGFDAVEPDNVDGYQNRSGFPLTEADQVAYLEFLIEAAHTRGLSIGLKNSVDLVAQLEPLFDFAVNEECANYDECETLTPFIDNGKAVFHVEYQLGTNKFCAEANALGFSSMKKRWDLDAWADPCW